MEVAFSGFATVSLQVLSEKLFTFVTKEIRLIKEADNSFDKIQRTLLKIQCIVEDLERSGITTKAVGLWSRHLKEAADDVEDLFDDIATDFYVKKLEDPPRMSLSFASKTDKLSKRLDSLLDEMTHPHTNALFGKSLLLTEQKVTSSFMEDILILGREEDKACIIQILKSKDFNLSSKELDVISIVGTVGIGKTTLAQAIYNDYEILVHFGDRRVWVSVPEAFDVGHITRSIVESLGGHSDSFVELNVLQRRLHHMLAGSKVLFVFDGIWLKRKSDWDLLLAPLRDCQEGTKILLTSQNQTVSRILGARHCHTLKAISDENCRKIFEREAFKHRCENDNPILASILKMAIQAWDGIPLVAKTMGRVLSLCFSDVKWMQILKGELELPEENNDIFPALQRTCYHVPPHLRQCMSFLSLFPPGFAFKKQNLIEMWAAEGYIRPGVEDRGGSYIDELVDLSLFRCVKDGDEVGYILPYIIHLMTRFMSPHDYLRLMDNSNSLYQPRVSKAAHHASVLKDGLQLQYLLNYKKLRTLLSPGKILIEGTNDCAKLCLKLKLLRVLDLSNSDIVTIPDEIANLKHLRYFDLSYTEIIELPSSVCSLYNLETLLLFGCTEFKWLPMDLFQLVNLQHLGLDFKSKLTYMPDLSRLPKLQYLGVFFVGRNEGSHIRELQKLKCIKGTLRISNLENVYSQGMAESAELKNNENIKKLHLRWSRASDAAHQVFAGLRPHCNLEEFEVYGYNSVGFPNWISDKSFCKLVAIKLSGCEGCVILPQLGKLPSLRVLTLKRFDLLEVVNGYTMGEFPSLDVLTLDQMPNLTAWVGPKESSFPRLRLLSISACPKLVTLPELQFFVGLQELHIMNCTMLQHLPDSRLPETVNVLSIDNCGILHQNCSEGGEDREKIEHIKTVILRS